MRRSATLGEILPKERQAVDECANYLLTYKDLLKYDKYLAQGLPIATGVIEGACRHLVKNRMDPHRRALGSTTRRGRSEAALARLQRRLRVVLGVLQGPGVKAQPRITLCQPPATEGCLTVPIVRKELHSLPTPLRGRTDPARQFGQGPTMPRREPTPAIQRHRSRLRQEPLRTPIRGRSAQSGLPVR